MAGKVDRERWRTTLRSIGIKDPPDRLTQRVVDMAQSHPLGKRYSLADGAVPDLMLVVGKGDPATNRASGSWVIGYRRGGVGKAGKRAHMTIGRADVLSLEAARRKAKDELRKVGDGLDPAHQRRKHLKDQITLGEYIAGAYTDQVLAHRARKAAHKFTNRMLFVWGALYQTPLRALSRPAVDSVLAPRLRDGCAPATALLDWANLRGVLRHAIQTETIPAMPFPGNPASVKDLVRAKRVRYLGQFDTAEEKAAGTGEKARLMAALAAFETPRIWGGRFMRTLIPLALSTAMRRNEMLKLTTDMLFLDGDKPQIHLPENGYTKNRKARVVNLNEDAVSALRAWLEYRATWPAGEAREGRGWRLRCPDGTFGTVTPSLAPGDKRLFPLSLEYLGGRADVIDWKPILAGARIPYGNKPRSLRFHDLRHTTASWLVMAGVPLITVRDVLGHSSIQMTERYAHLADDHARDALMAMRIADQ